MEEAISKAFTGETAHHAYLIVGKGGGILPVVLDLLSKENFPIVGNPDVIIREYDVFGIGESRFIREMQSRRGVAGKQYFILEIGSITPEAQNALLKTFEEPTADTRFFILSRSEDMFLPTLRSRLQIIRLPMDEERNIDVDSAREFIQSEPNERLRQVESLVKKGKEGKKSEITDFLDTLEVYLRKKAPKDLESWPVATLEKIINGKKILSHRGASAKLVLEDIALSL